MTPKHANTSGAMAYQQYANTVKAQSARSFVEQLTKKEQEQYSLARAIRAVLTNDRSQAGFEDEVSKALASAGHSLTTVNSILIPTELALERRDLNVSQAGAGGYLVSTTPYAEEIQAKRALPVIERLGARRITGLVGNVTLVKVGTGATTAWLPLESSAMTESGVVLGIVVLTPKTASAFLEVSRQLFLQSNVDEVIRRDLTSAYGVDRLRHDAGDLQVVGQPRAIQRWRARNHQ
jgi:HK97 family phage major capsid protein